MVVPSRESCVYGGPDHTYQAFGATFLILNSVLCAIFCAVILRVPHYGLVWALSPMLCTAGALTNPTRQERTMALLINLSQVAFFQWILSALTPHVFARVLAVSIIFPLILMRRNSANSGVVITGIISCWNHDVFLQGLDNMISMFLILCLAVPTFLMWDGILFSNWRGIPGKSQMDWKSGMRRVIAFACAMMIFDSVQWDFGSWLPLTLALAYSSGETGKNAMIIGLKRLALAPLGFLLSVFYLSTSAYLGVYFSYATVLWGVIGFFFSYLCKCFTFFYLPFIVMVSCADNLIDAESSTYGNGWDFFIQSSVAVAVGAALVILFESVAIEKDEPPS